MRYIIILIICLCFTPSFAINYYVNSKTGDRKNTGLSPAKAKKQIQEAANLTQAGDTVFVMNGEYANDCPTCNVLDVPVSGTSSKYIVYINYNNHKPKIIFNGWGGISIRDGVSFIKVSGFDIIGNNNHVTLSQALKQPKSCNNKQGEYDPRFNGNGIAIDGRNGKYPHHIIIANNTVHDCGGGGISAIHTDYVTVENNVVYNTSLYSLFATSAISFYQFWNYDDKKGYHNVIRRNKCYNNRSLVPWPKFCKLEDGNGIIIDDFANKQNGSKIGKYNGRTLIENNICWYNGGTGIHSFQSSHVDIINNTAYLNSKIRPSNAGEILAVSSDDVRIVNNILVADLNNRINSNYENTNIIYQNNLHYNTSPKSKLTVSITSNTCVVGQKPQFKLPKNALDADFSLETNSPAINKSNKNIFSQTDFTGKIRPKAKAADIGAYQTF